MKIRDVIGKRDGIVLIAVLFILLAIGGVGVAITKVSQNSATEAQSSLATSRSSYTAEGGSRWAVQQVVDKKAQNVAAGQVAAPVPGCPSCPTALTNALDAVNAAGAAAQRLPSGTANQNLGTFTVVATRGVPVTVGSVTTTPITISASAKDAGGTTVTASAAEAYSDVDNAGAAPATLNPPTGPAATLTCAGVATVTWTPPATGTVPTSYNVYYGTATPVTIGGDGVTKVPGGASGGAINITAKIKYYFIVTSVASGAESAASTEVSATVPAPTGVATAVGNATGAVTVSWTASGICAATYNVYYGTATGVTTASAPNPGVVGSTTSVTGLTNGTKYYFVVTAVDSSSTESAVSSEVNAVPFAPCTQKTAANGAAILFSTYVASASVGNISGFTGSTSYTTPPAVVLPAIPGAGSRTTIGAPPPPANGASLCSPLSGCVTPDAITPNIYYTNNLTIANGGADPDLTINGPTGVGQYLTFYINGDFTLSTNASMTINGNVRIVIYGDINLNNTTTINLPGGANLLMMGDKKVTINTTTVTGSAANCMIMARDDITIKPNGSFSGGLYTNKDVKIQSGATFTGAMVCIKDADNSGTVTYSSTAGSSVMNNMSICP